MSPRSVAEVAELVRADKQAGAVRKVAEATEEDLTAERHEVSVDGGPAYITVKGAYWESWDVWRAATTAQLANLASLQPAGITAHLQLRHESFKEFIYPFRDYLWNKLSEEEKKQDGKDVPKAKVLHCVRGRNVRKKRHLRTATLAFASTATFYLTFSGQRNTHSHPAPTSSDFLSLFSHLFASNDPTAAQKLINIISETSFRPRKGAPSRVPFSSGSDSGSSAAKHEAPAGAPHGPYPGVQEYNEELRTVFNFFKRSWKKEKWDITEESERAKAQLQLLA